MERNFRSLPGSPFSKSEFACIACPQSAVDAYLKLQEADRQIREAKEDVESARKAHAQSNGVLVAALKDDVGTTIKPDAPRVRSTVEEYRRCLPYPDPYHETKRKDLASILMAAFSAFNEVAFTEWLEERFPDDATDTSAVAAAKQRLVKAQETRVKVLRDAAMEVFKPGQLPKSVEKVVDTDAVTEMLLHRFVDALRVRARLFEILCTPNGVALYSLPEPSRTAWFRAYQALGLDKVTEADRDVRYCYSIYEGDDRSYAPGERASVLRGQT